MKTTCRNRRFPPSLSKRLLFLSFSGFGHQRHGDCCIILRALLRGRRLYNNMIQPDPFHPSLSVPELNNLEDMSIVFGPGNTISMHQPVDKTRPYEPDLATLAGT